LFVLLGLAACLAALRRRIAAFAEERLIVGGKREGLPAIAAHELLIFSHISLSSMLQVCAALNVLRRSPAIAGDRTVVESVELIDLFRMNSVLSRPHTDQLCFVMKTRDRSISESLKLSRASAPQVQQEHFRRRVSESSE